MTRMRFAAALAVVGALILASCAATPPTLEAPQEECVSWIDFDVAQDVYDNAQAVVVAESSETGRVERLFGVEVSVHRLEVSGVLKGEVGDGDVLEVLSTPLTCRSDGGRYPGDVDPLSRSGELLVYLSSGEDGTWRTLSPYDAAEPLPDDGTLPFLPGT